MTGRIARWGAGAGLAAVWWWAVLRLAFTPSAGALEGTVAAGGWGLSLLPVHCVPKDRARAVIPAGRWREAWRAGGRSAGAGGRSSGAGGGAETAGAGAGSAGTGTGGAGAASPGASGGGAGEG